MLLFFTITLLLFRTLEKVATEKLLKSSHDELTHLTRSEKVAKETQRRSQSLPQTSKSEEVSLRQPSREKRSNGHGKEREKSNGKARLEPLPTNITTSEPPDRDEATIHEPNSNPSMNASNGSVPHRVSTPPPMTKANEDDSADLLSSSEVTSDDEDLVKHDDGAESTHPFFLRDLFHLI